MATHRDSGPAETGASSYPGQAYHDVDYPTAAPGYPAGREGDRRYAERIPRYPESQQPDGAGSTDRQPGGEEDLRLTDEDGLPSRAVESPTTSYQPVSPAAPPQPATAQRQPGAPNQPLPNQPAPNQPAPNQGAASQGIPNQAAQRQTAQHQVAQYQVGGQQPVAGSPQSGQQLPHQQTAAQQSGPAPASHQPPPAPGPQQPVQQPVPSQQPGGQPPPAAQPAQQAAPQPAAPEPNAALADLLREPTQLTEQVPVYPGVGTGGGTVHHAHAQLGWLFGSLAILFDIPIAVVLVRSLMSDSVVVGGVVSGLLLLPGLPLLAAGFHQLFSGGIAVRPGEGLAALSRRPFALLFAGVVLVLAGAMAAG